MTAEGSKLPEPDDDGDTGEINHASKLRQLL
jgi:hypothetical protein